MNEWIDWFQRVLDVSIRLYFRQECDLSSVYDIALPKAGPLWKALLPEQVDPTFDEWMVLMLALMPHLSPQVLDIFFVSIFFPDPVIWLHHNLLHTVKCYDIKIAHGLVVFRRVSCRYDHPAFRNLMISESFALQELKHCRCQCL